MNIRRILAALALAVCLCLCAACGSTPAETDSVTETVSATESTSATESVTATDTETETARLPEPVAEGPCYVLTYTETYLGYLREVHTFYASVSDAVLANPSGADIFLCAEPTAEVMGVIGDLCTYPGVCVHTGKYESNLAAYFPSGAVYEYPEFLFAERIWFSSLDTLKAYFSENASYKLPLNQRYVWLLASQNGYDAGRYGASCEEDGLLTLTLLGSADRLCVPYVCRYETEFFYSVAEGFDFLRANGLRGRKLHLTIDNYREDDIAVNPMDGFTVAYDYCHADLGFACGAVYDDGEDGLCYYANLETLLGIAGLEGTYMTVTSDTESLRPGRYLMEANRDEEECDGDGNFTVYSSGNYTVTYIPEN